MAFLIFLKIVLYLFDGLRESGDELIDTEQELAVGGRKKKRKDSRVSFSRKKTEIEKIQVNKSSQ